MFYQYLHFRKRILQKMIKPFLQLEIMPINKFEVFILMTRTYLSLDTTDRKLNRHFLGELSLTNLIAFSCIPTKNVITIVKCSTFATIELNAHI
jgi:hypothetical protein